jgi:hypothetical protein
VTPRPATRRDRAGQRGAWALAAALLASAPAGAQPVPDALQFLGFRPGAPLSLIEDQVAAHGAPPLACAGARWDRRVQECRGMLYGETPTPLALRISVIDGVAAIILLTGVVPEAELARWDAAFEAAYGSVPLIAGGPQRMRQWIRGGTMLRLVWRGDARAPEVSVSLVDGPTLDGWGRSIR